MLILKDSDLHFSQNTDILPQTRQVQRNILNKGFHITRLPFLLLSISQKQGSGILTLSQNQQDSAGQTYLSANLFPVSVT